MKAGLDRADKTIAQLEGTGLVDVSSIERRWFALARTL
jgi:hypothetical protein